MPVLRSAFIALSHNRSLRSFSERSRIGNKLSSRFVAGLEIDDAMRVAESVNKQGMHVTLDSLGESVPPLKLKPTRPPTSTTASSTRSPRASSTPTSASSSPRWASR